MADTYTGPAPEGKAPAPERPNAVAGLVEKRKQLAAVRASLERELRKVTCDLDHLDAAIRLLDPAQTPAAVARYATRHRAAKGHLQRFVLERLRRAEGGTVTSREVTLAWVAARGLRADDGTLAILRKRVGACLIKLRARGVVRDAPWREGHAGYALAAAEGDAPAPRAGGRFGVAG